MLKVARELLDKINIAGIGTQWLKCLTCNKVKHFNTVPTDEQVMEFIKQHIHEREEKCHSVHG